jgi:large subunit ribosomal protein LX
MSMYEIQGRYKSGKIGKAYQSFSKVIDSENEKNAVEWVYALMGSEHGLKRNRIKIDGVKVSEQ